MNPTTIGALWIIGGTSLIALSDNFVAGVSREVGLWQFHGLRPAMFIARSKSRSAAANSPSTR